MIMNKAYNGNKKSLLFVLVMCLVLFNGVFVLAGCGLDTFYYIQAPVADVKPLIDDIQQDRKTFVFHTNESQSSDSFSYIGTDVYYKIYNKKEQWQSDKDYLERLSNDEETYAADKLIYPESSGGFGFQLLKISGSDNNVLIPYSGTNKTVRIRLTNDSTPEFSSFININGSTLGIPVRYNYKTFDFGTKNGPIPDPKSKAEADVKYTENPNNEGKWYISLFAVAKGRDAAYTNYFSNITYLGSVTIANKTK